MDSSQDAEPRWVELCKDGHRVFLVGTGETGKHTMVDHVLGGRSDPLYWERGLASKFALKVDDKRVTLYIDALSSNDRVYGYIFPRFEAFILVYAINDRNSFEELEEWRAKLFRWKRTRNIPIVLCGNKCDLKSQRVVSRAEGEQLAVRWGVPFFETSVYADWNVKAVFKSIVHEIRKKTRTEGEKEKRGHCILL